MFSSEAPSSSRLFLLSGVPLSADLIFLHFHGVDLMKYTLSLQVDLYRFDIFMVGMWEHNLSFKCHYEVVEETESRVEAESNVVKPPLSKFFEMFVAPYTKRGLLLKFLILQRKAKDQHISSFCNIVLWTTVKIPSEVLKQRLQAGIWGRNHLYMRQSSFMLQAWDIMVQI
ncbi:mitochondrial substrate carrier family protein [Tanacetum coccineum]|uniref:Photosystem I reaction center subunit VI n=1 Tax=Tanacetum coccineum TaxID=301880 RepID=A0ABQ4ZRI8_9ASTR